MRYTRWESVYAKDHKPQKLYHDHLKADVIGILEPDEFSCHEAEHGSDITMDFGETRWHVEIHRVAGQSVGELVKERLTAYAEVDDPVLWLVEGASEEEERHRLDAIFEHRHLMRNPYFATFTQLIEWTELPVMIDRNGDPSMFPGC